MAITSVLNTTLMTPVPDMDSTEDSDFFMVAAILLAVLCLVGGVCSTLYLLRKYHNSTRLCSKSNSSSNSSANTGVSRLTSTFRRLPAVVLGSPPHRHKASDHKAQLLAGEKKAMERPPIYRPTLLPPEHVV